MVQSVPEFYAGQKILVTGGTGFMGKVLIEKLLRSCPEVDTIYMVIRSKKGKSIEERWKDITNLPLFDKLKSTRPGNINKVKLISGELSRYDLGISDEDKQILIDNVTLVFHIAADVQFTESINDAVVQNVIATKAILDFSLRFKQLKVFLYVSTAFCNFNRSPAESVEKVLPACQDWKTVIKLQETEPFALQCLKEKLLCGHPVAYTWSKSLAEQIVKEYSTNFSTVIMRPAVVTGCAHDDPLKGWTDTLNGMSAFAVGAYTGILRVIHMSGESHGDFVSVDIATRAQLVAAKKAAEQNSCLDVYNCATASEMPVTLEDMCKYGEDFEEQYIFPQKIWKRNCKRIANSYLYAVLFITRQVLPCLLLDLCLKLAGQKQMLMRIAVKAANANRLFGRYNFIKIIFPVDNYAKLKDYVLEEDKEDFSLDISEFTKDPREVFIQQSLGIFKYIFKNDFSEEALSTNRKRYNRILLFRKVLKAVEYSVYGILLWKILHMYSPILNTYI